MSVYTPPALDAVDFELQTYTPADITPYESALSVHTPPALDAVDFALSPVTPPTFPNVGWELLPSGGITITGTLAATEAQDIAALTGALGHTGTLAAIEAQDAAALDGVLGHVGTLDATEAQDTAGFAGDIAHVGTIAATEAQDTAEIAGEVTHQIIVIDMGGGGGGGPVEKKKRRVREDLETVLETGKTYEVVQSERAWKEIQDRLISDADRFEEDDTEDEFMLLAMM